VEAICHETCIARPRLSRLVKVSLVARAWIATRLNRAA
jgi:hypothetical protein